MYLPSHYEPTFFKFIRQAQIKAIKAGKRWKMLESELARFLRGYR